MPAPTRNEFEASFGADLTDVRIHRGALADRYSEQLGAHALTCGGDIAFRRGRYRPSTREGRWLLAHELTHVVQQAGSLEHRHVAGQPTARRVHGAPVARYADEQSRRAALERQVAGNGINVALYLPPDLERHHARAFQAQAEQWADNHDAVAAPDGSLRYETAMPIADRRPERTLQRVLDAVHGALSMDPGEVVPLQTLAIFTHGFRNALQMGLTRGATDEDTQTIRYRLNRLRPLLDIVASAMNAPGQVIFYACSAAGPAEPLPGQEYQNLVHDAYEYLAERNVNAQVWSHNTARHTTGNPDTASTGRFGRQTLYLEMAVRSFPPGAFPPPLDAARCLRGSAIEALWREALAVAASMPSSVRSCMYALIEEVPMLGYDSTYAVLTGSGNAADALSRFSDYSSEDARRFTRGVQLVRERLRARRSAMSAAVEEALEGPPAGDLSPVPRT